MPKPPRRKPMPPDPLSSSLQRCAVAIADILDHHHLFRDVLIVTNGYVYRPADTANKDGEMTILSAAGTPYVIKKSPYGVTDDVLTIGVHYPLCVYDWLTDPSHLHELTVMLMNKGFYVQYMTTTTMSIDRIY